MAKHSLDILECYDISNINAIAVPGRLVTYYQGKKKLTLRAGRRRLSNKILSAFI